VPRLSGNQQHPDPTRTRGLRYEFTTKHHGGDRNASCWVLELTLPEEFDIFDDADAGDFFDDDGNLYGLKRDTEEGGLCFIGEWMEQIAEFPVQRDGAVWHGYPCYPLKEHGPENRRGDKGRPAREVFRNLYRSLALTKQECKRLSKGDHV
jgi:hypothetical protein